MAKLSIIIIFDQNNPKSYRNLETLMRISGTIWEIWENLRHFSMFWKVSGYFENFKTFWKSLENFGKFGLLLGSLGKVWEILGNFEKYRQMTKNHQDKEKYLNRKKYVMECRLICQTSCLNIHSSMYNVTTITMYFCSAFIIKQYCIFYQINLFSA